MLIPAAILVLAAGLVLAWLAWRWLPRPWNRPVALLAALPAALVCAFFAAGVATGWFECKEAPLWQKLTGDGRFLARVTSIDCSGEIAYNVLVEEQKPEGGGKVRAIWRSFGAPVPDAVDYRPPATFIVRAHDGTAARAPVAPAEVTLEGPDLTPSRMWSFHRGKGS
jgi:hypothetical protein